MEESNVPGVKFPTPIPIPNSHDHLPELKHLQTLTRELNGARNAIAALQWRVSKLEDLVEKD